VERMLIGICNLSKFRKNDSDTGKGVGEDGNSLAVDCCKNTVLFNQENRQPNSTATLRKFDMGNGSIIQVNIPEIFSQDRICSILVDGGVIAKLDVSAWQKDLRPAFSGKGTMKIKNVILTY